MACGRGGSTKVWAIEGPHQTNPPHRLHHEPFGEEVWRNGDQASESWRRTERYDTMTGRPLDEGIAVAVLIEPCVKELRDKLETVRGMTYNEVRN